MSVIAVTSRYCDTYNLQTSINLLINEVKGMKIILATEGKPDIYGIAISTDIYNIILNNSQNYLFTGFQGKSPRLLE